MEAELVTELTADPERAAEWILRGACVAFPTETVYGLGADATDASAVAGIFAAKGRPSDNPLIVHVAAIDRVTTVAASVSESALRILERFSPGPITVILPRRSSIPPVVSAGLGTVGVRIPAHDTALAFLRACGRPVAAPSANRSGRPSPTTWEAVMADLSGRIACVLRGPRSRVGLESTVVDCTVDPPVLLRAGAVTIEALRRVVPGSIMAGASEDGPARSPGTRHPHYAPNARVRVVGTDRSGLEAVGPDLEPAAWIGIGSAPPGYVVTCPVTDVDEYAHALFDFFRNCDALGIRRIDCQRVPRRGLGRALMDRIDRAQAATPGAS